MWRRTSLSLSIILLSMGARALAGLSAPAFPVLGLALPVCGATILLLPGSRGGRRPVGPSLIAAASAFGLALVSTPVLKLFAWRLHDISLPVTLHGIISYLLPGSGRSGDVLTFWTGADLSVVRITFEGLGLFEIWYLLVGLSVFHTFSVPGRRGRMIRSLPHWAVAIAAYAGLRYLAMVALALELGKPQIMWHPLPSILSWLPLAGFFGLDDWVPTIPRFGFETLTAGIGIGLVVSFLAGFDDPGHLKPGRVMIDEAHADWEWADEPFDTTAYGMRAEYNYYCLREYLGHFYDVSLNSEPLSSSRLKGADVLIIKTPTRSFGEDEILAIERFVAAGGGLLLIGDHTNLFGMTTHLNAIAGRFGMRFRSDDTFDVATTGFSRFRRRPWDCHPALRKMCDFGFLTSCSIEGGPRTRPVMLGSGLGSEVADYGHPNFFGNIAYELRDRFGVFLQAGSTRFGEGRVMLFSDSTCFSNFCMFAPGRCELALGMIDYLNRRGTRYGLCLPAAWLLLGGIVSSMLVGGSTRRPAATVTWRSMLSLPVLLAAVSAGLVAMSHLNSALYDTGCRQRTKSTKMESVVLFDTSHTTVSFFTLPGVPRGSGSEGFEALYVCAQRVGAHPCAGDLRDLASQKHSGAVVVNPSLSFSSGAIDAVDTFLKDGGTLLVMDSIRNGASTANEVLHPYGVDLRPVFEPGEPSTPRLEIVGGIALGDRGSGNRGSGRRGSGGRQTGNSQSGGQHGNSQAGGQHGNSRLVFVPVGRGALLVVVDSFRYSHHILGSLLERQKPSPLVRTLYSEVYGMFENLVQPQVSREARGNLESGTAEPLKSAENCGTLASDGRTRTFWHDPRDSLSEPQVPTRSCEVTE